MKINKHNFAKAFWHHCCLFLYWALHLAFPTSLLTLQYVPFLVLKTMPLLRVKVALSFIFDCLGLSPTSGGDRMGFFDTWRVLPTASHLVSALTSAGSGWCRAVALLASPPTPAWCWLGSQLTVDFSLQILRKWRIRAKNSWDLIACATSDKLESPKEAATDLYLCLYVTWVLSLCNFPGTSPSKFNKERNTGVCSLGPW